jgi:hypothetical protein
MVAPFEILQQLLKLGFEGFEFVIVTLPKIEVELKVAQMDQADLMTVLARSVAVGFRKSTGQAAFGGVSVEDQDFLGVHGISPKK